MIRESMPDQAQTSGSGLRQGERCGVEESPYVAVPGDRFHPHGLAVDDAHPGHAELSRPHGDAAHIAKQFVPAVHADNGQIDSAQHCVDAAELRELAFMLAPLRDVPGNSIYPDYIASRVAGEASASLDPPYLPAQLNDPRSEEHTSELQSPDHLVCRLLLEKKKNIE